MSWASSTVRAKEGRAANAVIADVYAFVADVENLALWATDFCRELRTQSDVVEVLTPAGWSGLHIVDHPASGTVDLIVEGPAAVAGTYFTRTISLGENRSLFSFTWPRPIGMTWSEFDSDWHFLEGELKQLRTHVEGHRL